jgi:ketosteroid isomerase-like protein
MEGTMTHPNQPLLREVYEAQSRGDLDAYLEFLADDFVLHIPGRSRIAGDYRAKDAVRSHFREIAELTGGTFRTNVHDVVAGDDHAVASSRLPANEEAREQTCRECTCGTSERGS